MVYSPVHVEGSHIGFGSLPTGVGNWRRHPEDCHRMIQAYSTEDRWRVGEFKATKGFLQILADTFSLTFGLGVVAT